MNELPYEHRLCSYLETHTMPPEETTCYPQFDPLQQGSRCPYKDVFLKNRGSINFINFINNIIHSENSLTGIDGSKWHATEAVEVIVLTCKIQILDLRDNRDL